MRKIYYNGNIYTGKLDQQKANYIITEGNLIVAIGYTEDMNYFSCFDGERVDLAGGMLMAGFSDAHAHPVTAAFQRSQIVNDFSMTQEDVLDHVNDYIKKHPEKDSYFGIGHAETIFGEGGPRKETLDAVCADKPIILIGCGGHDGWVNSKALETAGISRNHPDPVPGFQFYRKDESGELTGHLLESGPLTEVIQAIKPFVLAEVKDMLLTIFADYSSYGVTSIGDCGFICYVEKEGRELLDECIEKDLLKQRIFGSNQITEIKHLNGWKEHLNALRNKYDSDYVRINTWKLVNDGTIESRSAAMMMPFVGDDKVIAPLLYGSSYYDLCVEVAKAGFDLHLHAIGDRASHENLMAAKAIREAGFFDTRITNAHTQCVMENDIPLFAKYNVIANTTGVWLYGDPGTKTVLGERADQTFRMKSILRCGAKMSLGSDFPGDEFGSEPLKSIETGVTRQMLGVPDSLILKPVEERLSVQDMITGFTSTPAYQFRMEDKLGTVEAGKYADFVVLGESPFAVDPYRIHKIPILMTIMDGNVTFVKKDMRGDASKPNV